MLLLFYAPLFYLSKKSLFTKKIVFSSCVMIRRVSLACFILYRSLCTWHKAFSNTQVETFFFYHSFFNVSMRMKKGLRRCFLIIMIFNIIHQVMTFFFFLTFFVLPPINITQRLIHSLKLFSEQIEWNLLNLNQRNGWKVWWRFTHKRYHWNKKKSIYTNWDRGEHRWNAFLSQKILCTRYLLLIFVRC